MSRSSKYMKGPKPPMNHGNSFAPPPNLPPGGIVLPPPVKQVSVNLVGTMVPGPSATPTHLRNDKPSVNGSRPEVQFIAVGGFHRLEEATLRMMQGLVANSAMAPMIMEPSRSGELAQLAVSLALASLEGCKNLCWEDRTENKEENKPSPIL